MPIKNSVKTMISSIVALISGIIFGFGLIYSGMANPAIVQGFLDIFGDWNPALMWVMVGALLVTAIAVVIIKKRGKTLLNEAHHIPDNSKINSRLIIGGLIFGVGWGLVGICPAPAIVLAGQGMKEGLIFSAAMLVGMKAFPFIQKQFK